MVFLAVGEQATRRRYQRAAVDATVRLWILGAHARRRMES
jgi:hypothetical protein